MNHELNIFFQEHDLSSYTVSLINSLSSLGINVNLFTKQLRRSIWRNEGINIHFSPISELNWLLFRERKRDLIEEYTSYFFLRKTINRKLIKILHVNVASRSGLFVKAKKECKIPLVYTNHYVPEDEPMVSSNKKDLDFNENEKKWIPTVCEHSSEVVTVSKYAQKRLKEEFGIKSNCIYHGVDLNLFNPSLPHNKRILGLNPKHKIILYVARFGDRPYKDPFTFIKSIPLVLRHFPDAHFIMIGNGFLKPYAITLAKELSVIKNLTFFDFVKKLNLFYAVSDVFVLPSYNDNFGLVVGEAMACAKPVVVSNKGAPQEFVGESGLVFDYGSHYSLANKIIVLLENEGLRKKLGKKGYEIIKKNFTWEQTAKKYAQMYLKVL